MLTSQVYSEGLVDMRHPVFLDDAYLFQMGWHAKVIASFYSFLIL